MTTSTGSPSTVSCTVARDAARYAWAIRPGQALVVSRSRPACAATGGRTRIELCGRLRVEIRGESLEGCLPGRQGRMVLAYLVANRARPVSRDELMGALWPGTAPAAPGPALSTVLTRLRQTLGQGIVEGRHELWLRLPSNASIDLEVIQARAERADMALACGEPHVALEACREALALSEGRLLPEFAAPWVEERQREIDECRLAMLEVCARAGLLLGGHGLAAAERAARALVTQQPYRESGYALLMEIHAAHGDVAEALRVYDAVRTLLREELAVLPSPALVKLSERLLGLEGPRAWVGAPRARS